MNDCLVVYIEINIALRIDNEEIVGSQRSEERRVGKECW